MQLHIIGLFGPEDNPPIQLDLMYWSEFENVTYEKNENLTKKFSEEEVKTTILGLEKNTAPGPDHIPFKLY